MKTLEQYEEDIWNRTRKKYEDAIIAYTKKLIEHMGCNHIELPLGPNLHILIKPKESEM